MAIDSYTDRTRREKAVQESKTLDELFTKVLKPVDSLSSEERENYEYFKQQTKQIEQSFERYSKQFVWGHERPGRSPEKLATVRRQKAAARVSFFDDEYSDRSNDDKFIEGVRIARDVEPDPAIVRRAAQLIKEKSDAYAKVNVVVRFFSHLNPFGNKYRTMREELRDMKEQTIEATGCKRDDLENFVSGKTKSIPNDGNITYVAMTDFVASHQPESRMDVIFAQAEQRALEAQLKEATETERMQEKVSETNAPANYSVMENDKDAIQN